MLPAILLALREGVEIVLILSIIFGTLRKLNQRVYFSAVWTGSLIAVAASITVAITLQRLGASLSGRSAELFEGGTMLLAAVLLTWMIFWMQTQARSISSEIEAGVKQSVFRASKWALFSLAFIAVAREGIELAIFFSATALTSNISAALVGTILGIIGAGVVGYIIFTASIRLDIRLFFQITGVVLILFAAGLIGQGVHELNEAGILPVILEHVWDISSVLDDQTAFGTILKTLFGYNANPSLIEALAYIIYMGGVVYFLRRGKTNNFVSQKT